MISDEALGTTALVPLHALYKITIELFDLRNQRNRMDFTLKQHPTLAKPEGPVLVCILDGWVRMTHNIKYCIEIRQETYNSLPRSESMHVPLIAVCRPVASLPAFDKILPQKLNKYELYM